MVGRIRVTEPTGEQVAGYGTVTGAR
jgi:hypothetical protein